MYKFISSAVLCMALALPAMAAEYQIEISLETAPAHIRNTTVVALAKKIEEAAGGRLAIKVFHGSSKYRGKDEPTALAQNALDMAVTGNWYLGGVISDFNITALPMFYGVPREKQYAVWDGEVGQALNKQLEEKLGVKVLGRWLDLGFGSMFFTKKKVTKPEDLVGMKMRVAGGAANSARYQVLGASSVSIPFKEVAQALQRGTVDGMMSTHESVRSAKFWDAGVKYAYDDYQAFYQYVPMMSSKAWNGLPEDIQNIILAAWNDNIDSARQIVADRQESAAEEEKQNGVEIVIGSPGDLSRMREKLMQEQARLVAELKVDPALVEKAQAALGN